MMKAIIVKTPADFEKLNGDWNDLFDESKSNNIFITFEWQFLYWKHFGGKNSLFIIVVSDGGKTAAILPFMVNKRFGFRELHLIGYPASDYGDILVTNNEAKRGEALQAAMELLARTRGWDIIRLKGLREDSPAYRLIRNVSYGSIRSCLSSIQQHCDGAPEINLACGWNTYYSGLRKPFAVDIRARRKRAGDNIEYIPGDTLREEELRPILGAFMDMHVKRIKEIGGKSFFEDDRMRNFFYSVSLEFFKKKRLELSRYKINGALAAMEIGFIQNGRFYRYLTAFDSQFKKCSAARLLLFEIIKHCFDKGLATFDFMLGEESYKRFWNPVPHKLFFWTMYKKTLSGHAAYMIFNRLNLLYKKIMKKKW